MIDQNAAIGRPQRAGENHPRSVPAPLGAWPDELEELNTCVPDSEPDAELLEWEAFEDCELESDGPPDDPAPSPTVLPPPDEPPEPLPELPPPDEPPEPPEPLPEVEVHGSYQNTLYFSSAPREPDTSAITRM